MYRWPSVLAWLFSRLNPTTSVDSCGCRTAGATTRPLTFVSANGDVLGDCREVIHIGDGQRGDDIAVTRGGDGRGQRRIGLPGPNIESCHEIRIPGWIRPRHVALAATRWQTLAKPALLSRWLRRCRLQP